MTLTLEEAMAYIDAAIDKAKELEIQVSLAVVDQFGQVVQVDRMDGASGLSPDMAEAKAATAANFKRPTSQLAAMDPEVLKSIKEVAPINIMAISGGVPIYKDGELVGGIGVSGASGAQDEEVANHCASR